MKRSRTCQCLQELDVPKRSRSTPDLGVLQRKNEVFGARIARNNYELATLGMDGALRYLLQPQPADVHQRATTLAARQNGRGYSYLAGNGSFAFDSIVRPKSSLNEVTILEHEQFIGEESHEMGMARETSDGSYLHYGGSGGLVHLMDDSGDSSDYFCGVDSNSDEADDEDGACRGVVASLGGDGLVIVDNGHVSPRASAKSVAAEVVVQQHQERGQSSGHCAPETPSSSGAKPYGYDHHLGACASPGLTTVGRGLEWKPVSLAVSPTASCSEESGDETERSTVSPPWPGGAPGTIDWQSEAAMPSLHVTIETPVPFATPPPHVAPRDGMESCSDPCRPSPDLFGRSVAATVGGFTKRHRSCHSLPIGCVGEEVTLTLSLERMRVVDGTMPTKVPARVSETGPDPLWKCWDSSMAAAPNGPMEHHRRGVAYL